MQLTQQATQHLVRVRSERGLSDEANARFVPSRNGIALTFANEPGSDDTVVKTEDINVYVAPEIADKLDRGTIDVDENEGKTGLVLRSKVRKAKS